jgi:hypothetical protein
MTIARAIVLHGGGNAMVPECASDQGEIHVSRHKVRGQGVLGCGGAASLPAIL